jgi:hypothetical protein
LADANEVMTILSDIGTAMTGSVASDGQTPITGQFKGQVSVNPTYSFNADLNTGVGSDTTDVVYLMAGGVKIATVSAAGLDILSGKLLSSGAQLVPTGVCFDYVGAAAPAGYVLGNGGSIGNALSGGTARANADAQPLFELIWNSANQTGGEGQVQDSAGVNVARGANATADFNANRRILVADYQDRTSRGKSGSTSLGQTLGADTVTIAQGNFPAATNLTVTIPAGEGNHGHTMRATTGNGDNTDPNGRWLANTSIAVGGGAANIYRGLQSPQDMGATTTNNTLPQMSGTAALGGSGTPLNVQPRSIVKTKIIKL